MLTYCPALRFKQGEYLAAARIQSDIQRHIEPFFIIPPALERDPERGEVLTPEQIAHLTGERIGKHWPLRRAYLDTQHVAPGLLDDGLVRLYRTAQGHNPQLVPVVPLSDIRNPLYRRFLLSTAPRMAVHIPVDEIDLDALVVGLKELGCRAEDCDAFIDFTGTELIPDLAAPVVAGTFDLLYEAAPWRRVIFQGSNYPLSNPAEAGRQFEVPRHEWETFWRALDECHVPRDRIGFGDFGADCGKIKFPRKKGGATPIRHVRYTTPHTTLVIRGSDTGCHATAMSEVLNRLISSGHFAGQGFSYADHQMWKAAHGLIGCGNASVWREWNMAHHMTRVVRDLGRLDGREFELGPESTVIVQPELL